LFRNQTVSLGIEKNGGRLFRRPKLTLSCSAEGKKELTVLEQQIIFNTIFNINPTFDKD
jgi:hypothetical protein